MYTVHDAESSDMAYLEIRNFYEFKIMIPQKCFKKLNF